HRACRSGTPLHLTAKEFLLLAHLVRRAGEVVSRNEIANQIWDINFPINTNVVDVMVRRLRAKVDDPFKEKLVRTIRGVGYVLKSDYTAIDRVSACSPLYRGRSIPSLLCDRRLLLARSSPRL